MRAWVSCNKNNDDKDNNICGLMIMREMMTCPADKEDDIDGLQRIEIRNRRVLAIFHCHNHIFSSDK